MTAQIHEHSSGSATHVNVGFEFGFLSSVTQCVLMPVMSQSYL